MLGVVSRLKRRFHFFHGEGEVSWGSCDLYGLLYRVSYCIEFHFVSYHSFIYLSWSLTSSRNPTQSLAKFLLPHLPWKKAQLNNIYKHLTTREGQLPGVVKCWTSFQATSHLLPGHSNLLKELFNALVTKDHFFTSTSGHILPAGGDTMMLEVSLPEETNCEWQLRKKTRPNSFGIERSLVLLFFCCMFWLSLFS